MDEKTIQVLDVKASVLEDNDADANLLRQQLKERGTFLINVMSSPGAGKTTTLVALIEQLKESCRIGVMEADIDSDVDAYAVQKAGASALQIHTGGMCHLDADMTRQAINSFEAPVDIVFLENVGNLVCPAEYDTGSFLNLAILSIPEGDDKPAKYPLMFSMVDAVIFNKIDAIDYFDFDFEKCIKDIQRLNPEAEIFKISAIQKETVKPLSEYIVRKYQEWK